MIIGIDASNIRSGGGITHLKEFLNSVNPEKHGITKFILWSGINTLSQIRDVYWLQKVSLPVLDKGLLHRALWQRFSLSKVAVNAGCDLLYVPGGSYAGWFKPVVAFSQNLLPFEFKELKRYGFSGMFLKMLLLRYTQSATFKKANGVVYLTDYSRVTVEKVSGKNANTTVIAHGIDPRFFKEPVPQKNISTFSNKKPLKLLYVSTIDVYKHQWQVVDAVATLIKQGIPVVLELVGSANESARQKLYHTIERVDSATNYIQYTGEVSFDQLHKKYHDADLFVYASSCENMPNILIEAMASGLPIACSNRGPMPEILGDAGVYFDPEKPKSISAALSNLISSSDLRDVLAGKAFQKAQQYSWVKCADQTCDFFKQVLKTYKEKKYV